MEILSKEKSKEIITKLCNKFGFLEREIEKYLRAKSFSIPNIVGFDLGKFPFLWFPQPESPSMKTVWEIWEDVMAFEDKEASGFWPRTINTIIAPIIMKLDINNTILAAGEWNVYKKIGHRALKINKVEMEKDLSQLYEGEAYFFPEDLSWVICNTHESFGFIAGSKEFIDKIRENFPDYKKYEPEYWREMLGSTLER